MDKTNEKLISTIFDVGRQIKQELIRGKCLEDFTQTEIEILKFIGSRKKVTMKAVAEHLCIKPSSATSAVERLVEKGSIKRVYDKNDRRVVYIEFTTKGLVTLKKKYKVLQKTIKDVFSGLSNKEKIDLIKIFEKIHGKNK